MRFVRHAALALLLSLLVAGPVRAEGFLTAYEDLPLAPGLAEVPDGGISFDSPAGRIVEAVAEGRATAPEILRFYAATLPQLGWSPEGDTLYRRESEVLRLEVGPQGKLIRLRFVISPE